MRLRKAVRARFAGLVCICAVWSLSVRSLDAAPTDLFAKAFSNTQVSLTWLDAAIETGFRIERAPSPTGPWVEIALVPNTVKSYTDTDLSAGTLYAYRVRGFTRTANTAYSNVASVTTTGSYLSSAPSTPSGLNAAAISTSQINLSWVANSTNASSYKLERAMSDAGPWAQIASIPAPSTIYHDAGLSPSTYYVYRVRAYNDLGYSGYSASSGTATQAPPPPATPTGLSAAPVSTSQIALRWFDNAGNEAGYKVERAAQAEGPWSQIAVLPADTTAYTNSALASATFYAYRVRAFDDLGDSGYSGVSSATTFAVPLPSAPSWLTVIAIGPTQIVLNWSDEAGNETGYVVERSSTINGPWTLMTQLPPSSTSYTQSALTPSTFYAFRVAAYNQSGNSPYSSVEGAITLDASDVPPVSAPSSPTGLTVTAVAYNQISLTWTDQSNNEAGFKVERATSASGPWTQVGATATGENSFTSDGLAALTTYYYRVRASNAVGDSGYSNTASSTTLAPPLAVPAAPSGLKVSPVSSSQINLGWADNSSAETGFKIERATSASGPWSQIASLGAGTTSYAATGLNPATLYYFRVRATNAAGDSGYSNTAVTTTMSPPVTVPSAPTGLGATAISSSQIYLSWIDNSNTETGFKIERATSASGPWTQIANTTANVTTFAGGGLNPSTIYYFRIRATNPAGDSAYAGIVSATTLSSGSTPPTTTPPSGLPGFAIPTSHPRIWWNSARLAQARAWYASHPFTPDPGDPFANAFRYSMTGEATFARVAIDWLMNYTIPQAQLDGIASDNARWDGENAILTYDWCYAQMTSSERSAILSRWNGYLDTLRQKGWGGVGMEMNNYYWGYLRNELEWGIATYGENPMAISFLNTALITRWQNSFVPFAATDGKGGVPQEGPGYGAVNAWYPLVPFTTAGFLGRSIWTESPFFKEFVFYLIYATTPAPTSRKNDPSVTYELFPFNDSEYPQNGSIFYSRKYYGDSMNVLANQWSALPVGQYARRWLNRVGPSTSAHVTALDAGGPEKDFSSLPLDFFADGEQYLYSRSNWGTGTTASPTTALHLLLGRPHAVGHSHRDAGSFQLWRNGRWLARNTSGYADTIVGFTGSNVDVSDPVACNSVLINGIGQLPDSWAAGDATVVRLESKPAYLYAAVDLTPLYKANGDFAGRVPEASISSYVREFVFLRASGALYVCDRIDAGAGTITATFLLHSEQSTPLFNSSALVGAPVATRVVGEGSSVVAQTRFEYDYTIAGKSHFVRQISPANISDGNVVQFNSSTLGGSLNGTPFSNGVQTMTVTDAGPVW